LRRSYYIFVASITALLVLICACMTIEVVGGSGGSSPVSKTPPPTKVFESMKLIEQLEKLGINDTREVLLLKRAVGLSDTNFSLAEKLAEEAFSSLSEKFERRNDILLHKRVVLIAKAGGAVGLIVALAVLLPRAYLEAWYRVFRKRVIRVVRGKPRPSMLFDQEVQAVIAAIIVVAIVFSAARAIAPSNPEPFSAIGLLGEKGKIGDYPREVVVGDRVKLYIYLHNHMGHTCLYRIDYKIDRNATLNPSPSPAISSIYVLLKDNETTLIPFTAIVNETGKLRLVWELYIYTPENNTFTYTKEWVHLWVYSRQPSPLPSP